MLPLLLPAPRFHECMDCGITSNFLPLDGEAAEADFTLPLYFVDPWGDGEFDMCDLCYAEYHKRLHRREGYIDVSRGVPGCSQGEPYFGFEKMPVVCYTDASGADWSNGTESEREHWLFCRTRAEWKTAWQIARILLRYGYWPSWKYGKILSHLPAYKPPGAAFLHINEAQLNRFRTPDGTMWAICDGCHRHDVLVLRPGTQWANCERCSGKNPPRGKKRRNRKKEGC